MSARGGAIKKGAPFGRLEFYGAIEFSKRLPLRPSRSLPSRLRRCRRRGSEGGAKEIRARCAYAEKRGELRARGRDVKKAAVKIHKHAISPEI